MSKTKRRVTLSCRNIIDKNMQINSYASLEAAKKRAELGIMDSIIERLKKHIVISCSENELTVFMTGEIELDLYEEDIDGVV